ncbi:PAS domain-containing protein [Acetobacter okinawensis]|uniref:ATP-binding protein n=1 Tax=Acetobacter okinawensis TaxID=1076594 RepID=UPI001BABADEA|nr:ATP-binding protein [Acetobacter okinawensis]MBS0964556.1 PAS domain-containing protein [Acetobacter okinawensis]
MTGKAPQVEPINASAEGEQIWLNVIGKMEETWGQLIGQQVELERKNAALEEAHAFMASVFESMSDVLIACDTALRIVRTNTAAEKLFAPAGQSIVGVRLEDLIASASGVSAMDVARCMSRRQGLEDAEFQFSTSSGALPFAVNGTLLYDRRKRLCGIVLLGRPLGEVRRAYSELDQAHRHLKAAHVQLVQAEKMASLGRLVAGVAHELNNPISFVYGNAYTLKRFIPRLIAYLEHIHAQPAASLFAHERQTLRVDMVTSELGSTLDGIVEGAERVRDIVADLRRFSSDKRSAGAVFDMAAVVLKGLEWVLASADRMVETRVDVEEPLEVEGHAGRMQQVVMNLVQNALDAMEDIQHPVLCVTAKRDGTRVHIQIADNGSGIPPDVASHIFDPFFTTKPVGKGTGLGLAICYGTVSEHGGQLTARNGAQGGAVVMFDLPAFAPDGACAVMPEKG